MLQGWRKRAQQLKRETYAIYLAYQDPRTPWPARLFAAAVVAYALSPIDLIPDPIPVLGYLDDLILVPLGIALALRMIPPVVMADCRSKAEAAMEQGKPGGWVAALATIVIWQLLAGLLILVAVRALKG